MNTLRDVLKIAVMLVYIVIGGELLVVCVGHTTA